jgi:hypothetical protein
MSIWRICVRAFALAAKSAETLLLDPTLVQKDHALCYYG